MYVHMGPRMGGDMSPIAEPARDREPAGSQRRPRASSAADVTDSILETAQEAIVLIDATGSISSWNPAAEATFGWTTAEAVGRDFVGLLVPGPERGHDGGALPSFGDGADAGLVNRRIEIEMVDREGRRLPVEAAVFPLRAEGAVSFMAFLLDISERREREEELLELHRRFSAAFENAPIGMALVGMEGRFLVVNRSLATLTGRSEEELGATDFQAITHPDDVPAALEHLERLVSGRDSSFCIEKRDLRPDGTIVWMSLDASLVRQREEPLYFVFQMQDITARKASEDQLRRYAEHLDRLAKQDPLTGLTDRREFDAALERDLQRSERYGSPFSLVVFDLDRFYDFNQTHGRVAGDRALREVGTTISRACRDADLAARVAGDRFAMLLPETGELEAFAAADRIRGQVRKLDAGLEASFGVAEWAAGGETAELMLSRADRSLRAGRLHADEPSAGPPDGDALDALYTGRAPRRRPITGVRRTVATARKQLGMDLACLTEFTEGRQVVRALDGAGSSFGLEENGVILLEEGYCQRVVDGRLDGVIRDARKDRRVRDLPMTDKGAIGAYIGVPLLFSDGRLYGTLFCASHEAKRSLGDDNLELMRFLSAIIAERLETDELEAHDRRMEIEVTGIHALLAALEARDHYTGKHSRTVVELATATAGALGLPGPQTLEIEQVAILHDIGKVGVPDAVLQKEGPLNPQEWELMRQHPAIGARIVASTDSLAHLAPAVRAEHERWDGGGYPDGLAAEAIPLASRIAFACDAFHAITSDRPYRAALPAAHAIAELEGNAGGQFDPGVVAALVRVLGEWDQPS